MDSSSSSESEFSDISDVENDKKFEDKIEISSSSDSETDVKKSAKKSVLDLASNLAQYPEAETSSFSSEDFSPKLKKPRRSLTLQEPDSTKEIKHYFKKMKKFWTKCHNLKRASAPITVPTFDKARERMLGKYYTT